MFARTGPMITRRDMIAWGGGTALATASLSGCGLLSTEPASRQSGGAGGDLGLRESPMLADRVAAGDLPPLPERLPTEPLVVPVGTPGGYGGTFVSPTIGPGDEGPFWRMIGYEPPMRKNPLVTETLPNLCTAVEANDDGTEFTLALRAGTRWSDGEPFTADDIVFAVREVYGNTEINPSPPSWLSQNGELATVRKDSETRAVIVFAEPSGTFLESTSRIMDLVRFPRHYAREFLPEHNPRADEIAQREGFESWVEYWGDRTDQLANPELPTLTAWKMKTPLGEGNEVVLERNPYYWKTDPDGRQLPYIDTLSYPVVTDTQVILLKTTDGEFDLIYREADTTPTNKPVYAQGREQGGYQLVENTATYANTMCIQLNLVNKDPARRELYRNKDFRIGLSHAIDRKELITAVWQRQGEPWQPAPTRDSRYFDEEFATQYTGFDPGLAEQHLDRAGITERDDEGFRTLANGDRLTVTLDMVGGYTPEWPPAADMIKQMWQRVGIRLNLNTIDRTLFYTRKAADSNQHDAAVWFPTGGYLTEVIDPRAYFPFSDESLWATPWALWYSSRGSSGQQPVPAAREQIELYWELEQTPDAAARERIFRRILAIAKEQFWVIGIGLMPGPYMVVRDRLKNVTGNLPYSWAYRTPAHANPETWYLDS